MPHAVTADGVVGSGLCQCCQLQLLRLRDAHGVLLGHMELALCQCAGLIHDHNFRMGECLQIVAALDQNACLEAQPMPPKKLRGTEMTSAHGQEIIRNVSAR